jgi:hypothetical protein
MVLEDGETYASVEGWSFMIINQKAMDELCEGYEPSQLEEKDILHTIKFH